MNNNTTEDYVSFEVAKLLKEKGFSAYCTSLYTEEGKQNDVGNYNGTDDDKYISYSRPTHALAIKWIRENFGIHIYAQFQTWDDGCYTANWCLKQDILWLFYDIGVKEKDGMLWKRTKFNKPEEAIEAALLYTLKNLIQ